MANNPIDKYQYPYGSGLINPLATTSDSVMEDYYVICKYLPDGAGADERPDFLELGDAEGIILSVGEPRACVWFLAWPEAELRFEVPTEDMGINDYGAREYRWYWDSDHPQAFISFQLIEECRVEGQYIKYCIVMDVCDAPALLKGGGVTVTATTGLVSQSFRVAIQQTWMD